MAHAGEATPQDPRGTHQNRSDAACGQYSNWSYSTPALLWSNARHRSVESFVAQAGLREPFTGRTKARHVARARERKGGGLEENQQRYGTKVDG